MIAASAVFTSCTDSNSEDTPLGAYQDGIFVVNEGNSTAGSVSFIGNDMLTTSVNPYGAENGGDGVGGYVQSVFFNGDKAYIVSGSANKITIVNRYTFKLIDKIETGLAAPRYGVVIGSKAYVTNFNNPLDNTDDFVSVINLDTKATETTIPLNTIADRIILENNKLYITNGSYGYGHSVTVINPQTNAIAATIETGLAPTSFETENGSLYVLCSNYSDPSQLVKINMATNAVSTTVTFAAALTNAQNLSIEDGKAYFTVGNKVYASALDATSVADAPLFTADVMNLYGFTTENDKFYITDARDYTSDGKVFVYSQTGTLQNQFTVGLIPNGVYFND